MRAKYPSTPHLPFSRSLSEGDFTLDHYEFYGKECVVTEKLDGENTTLYRDGMHARSMDSQFHPSRSWAAAFQGANGWKIPEDTRVIAENMYAEHSIRYEDLESFLYGIAVVKDDTFLAWDEAVLMFNELGMPNAPVLWRGIADKNTLVKIANEIDPETQEGFVVRSAGAFLVEEFQKNVAKYVRQHHVQTDDHWTRRWQPNKLASQS